MGLRKDWRGGHRLRLSADVGGTFTDIAAFDAAAGRLLLGKTLTTPARLADGIEAGEGRGRSLPPPLRTRATITSTRNLAMSGRCCA